MTGGIRNTVCVLFAVVLISSCQVSPGRSVSADPELTGYDSPLRYPLSLEAAREAHRRAELRRHLRFLEAIDPGYLLRATAPLVRQVEIDSGKVPLGTLYETGRLLFEHEYSFADGLGARGASQAAAGGQSPFRRVHQGRFGGPETTTCTSCHWRGGPAGAGALQDNSFLYGDGDALESADPRNPPPLQGVGVVEVLAQEMSAELQSLRASLRLEARRQGREVEGSLPARESPSGFSVWLLMARWIPRVLKASTPTSSSDLLAGREPLPRCETSSRSRCKFILASRAKIWCRTTSATRTPSLWALAPIPMIPTEMASATS